MTEATRQRPALDWLLLCAWVGVIYATLPVARWIRDWFTERGKLDLLGQVPIAILAAGLAAGLWWLVVRRRERRPSTYVYLALIVAAYAVVLVRLAEFAVERLHLIEYGLVAYFAVRCTRHTLERRWAYGVALLIVVNVGYVDEVIQYFLPLRYYDPRDVVTNALSGLLGLFVVMAITRPDATGASGAIDGQSLEAGAAPGA